MQKIPETIHYCWFGKQQKPKIFLKCLASWNKYCPHYKIIEWNESNFDVNAHSYTKKAYNEGRWAFVSDYARIKILNTYGGIYLDTDVELIKPVDPLLLSATFLGFETKTIVNTAIVGAIKDNAFLKDILQIYDNLTEFETIPNIVTRVLNTYGLKEYKKQIINNVSIYPTEYFYPTPFGERFSKDKITKNTYTIHWWDYSWGSTTSRLFNKLGILNTSIQFKKYIKHLIK